MFKAQLSARKKKKVEGSSPVQEDKELLEWGQWRLQIWLGDRIISPVRKGWGCWTSLALGGDAWGETSSMHPRGCQEGWAKLFSVVPSTKTNGSGHKLKCSKFYLNMRKSFLTLRVTENWKRLPRVLVESPLDLLKTHLNITLCNLL